ncbi:MAG TPA: peptidase [Lachnospiraceae bacterium]|uniref:zinc metallopeptidase n=1 Tax=Anaerosporobacter sp. TaxID=1872529 RepID=UPI000EECCCFD|nr:zinc metallopeptidase [Anaerosporobacter sp.]HAB59256.1 peptidase [Lachnospiraceae bacterium]
MALFYGYRYYFDPTYMLVIIGVVISLLASAKVKSTFAKYSNVRSMSGLTGAQAAERILRNAGIFDVSVQRISGHLTDHYDPKNKVLRLSDSVFGNTSVSAIGVAAHECGHAIQHNKEYAPLRIRTALVPIANFGATLSWPLILIGVLLSWSQTLITLGIVLFCAAVLFQLVTLPVEFNASNRAVKILASTGILSDREVSQTKQVLGAAALTYVAAAAASILQLLRLIILFGGNRNRD